MRYRERLHVPALWWVLAAAFALTLVLAVGLYVGAGWGVATFLASLAVVVGLFANAAVMIRVDETGLRVGRGWVEHRYLAGGRALDPEQTRRLGGADADARAHLVLRPYISTAVEITLDDPADPVPYWLVSTRRPEALAAALTATPAATPRPDTAGPGRTS